MTNPIQIEVVILHYHEDEQLIRARIFVFDNALGVDNDFVLNVSYAPDGNIDSEEIKVSIRNNKPYAKPLLECAVEDLEEYQEFVAVCQKNKPLVAIYALYSLYGVDISPEIADLLNERGFPLDYDSSY